MLRTVRGFSLIELMIAIAIVAIVAMVALPSYQENARKTRRADAKITLESYAALQERWFAQNNSYTNSIANLGGTTSIDEYYTITLDVSCDGTAPFTCFDLTAAPKAGGQQVGDRCETFTIDETAARGYTGAGGSVNHCW